MRKHIIVEGPDASGKDTLIRSLLKHFPDHTLHERASTSTGGPVSNLAVWTARDVGSMGDQPPSIYNRHPIISEPIYAKYRIPPGHQSQEWTHAPWVHAMRNHVSKHAVVVLCRPSFFTVRQTIFDQGVQAHMPGVYANILHIYLDYYTWYTARGDMRVIPYDYTQHRIPQLIDQIKAAMTNE